MLWGPSRGERTVRTGELVKQKLHRADVEVQLVHVMLTEVADLQVSGENEDVLARSPSEGKQQLKVNKNLRSRIPKR